MWDTVQKLTYRAKANIPHAAAELEERLLDRQELPLSGIHGERLYLTRAAKLKWRANQLQIMYEQVPEFKDASESILVDAWTSAFIEGACISLPQVRQHLEHPQTKDERMVANSILGTNYAYARPITRKNLRFLWEKVTEGVCENVHLDGKLYRSDMVAIGNMSRTVHEPATPERIPALMEQWFRYREQDRSLIGSFVAHFYFVYVHPFCDGNGRTARIINASSLYHSGWKKMKSLPLSNSINNELAGYYRSLEDSEKPITDKTEKWLDIFEQCMIDVVLFGNKLSPDNIGHIVRASDAITKSF